MEAVFPMEVFEKLQQPEVILSGIGNLQFLLGEMGFCTFQLCLSIIKEKPWIRKLFSEKLKVILVRLLKKC